MFQDNQQPVQPVEQQPIVQNTQQQASPPTPPLPQMPPPVVTTQEERVWAAIGYIGFLGLLSLAMMPKSEFCKKHAAHGLTIFCLWFIILFVVLIVFWPFPAVIVSLLESVIFLGAIGLGILGIIKSIQSYEMNIPILTPIAMKFPVNAIIGTIVGKVPEKTEPPVEPQNQQKPQ